MRHYLFIGVWVLQSLWLSLAYSDVPKVQDITTEQAINYWAVEDHYLPIVAIRITFTQAGYAYDPKGKEGVAYLATSLLDEGTELHSALEFQKALEALSTTLRFSVSQEHISVSIKTLSANVPEVLALVTEAIMQPAFESEAIDRIKRKIQTIRMQQQQKPDYLAYRRMLTELYGNHVYARQSIGEGSSIAALTRQDLVDFMQQNFTRSNMQISVVGDVTIPTLSADIDRYLSPLIRPFTPKEDIAVIAAAVKGQRIVMDKDFPQTEIYFATEGPLRQDPDFYAAYVANHILGGGGFESLLTQVVREEHGLAYGIYTYLDATEKSGIWVGNVATNAQQAEESRAHTYATIEQFYRLGATAEQLAEAQEYLTGSFPLQLMKNEQIVGYLARMQLQGLGTDYLQKRNQLITDVSLEAVNRVIGRYLDPKRLLFVSVGKNVN